MYKITFSSTSADWANKIVCSQVTWSAYLSESILSSDKSTIYSFFAFGSLPTYYLYFAGLSASNGSVVTTRYKSNTSVFDLKGSALNGDYVVTQKLRLNRIRNILKLNIILTDNITN